MDLATIVRILVRRWVIFVPIVLLTAITAWQAGETMDPDYQAEASVLLIGSSTLGDEEVNPLTQLGRPLETTALALAIVATDRQTRQNLAAEGATGSYDITVRDETPIINVRVRARTPDAALVTLDAVLETMQLSLIDRQEQLDAPEDALIRATTLSQTTSPTALYGARDRLLAALFALGLIAAVTASVVFDQWRARRPKPRRSADATDPATPVVSPAPSMTPALAAADQPSHGRAVRRSHGQR